MNNKLLSIIIPVYNVEEYLAVCIESVLEQITPNIEIIIVDDGSVDSSPDIIRKYSEKNSSYIKVVTQQNSGLSSARNIGVSNSIGEYIYFLDSDDYLLDNAIQIICENIKKYSSADIFQFDNIITTYNDRLNIVESSNEIISFKDYFLQYQCRGDASVCAVSFVYKRIVWEKYNLRFEIGRRYEDKLFLYSLLKYDLCIVVIHLETPFYAFRINREGSISTNVSLNHYIDRQYSWRIAFGIFQDIGVDTEYYNNIYKYCLWVLCESYEKQMIKSYRTFFCKKDLMIMKFGIMTLFERKLWLLAKISPILMTKYYLNKVNMTIRRIINICFSVYDNIFPIIKK